MGLSEDQKNLAMVITGKVSGGLSVVSSLFIIRDIYRKWKAKRRSEHLPSTTLLVLSMSVGDVGSSFFAFFLGSWMTPTEDGFPLAAGTEASCDAQAFLFGIFYGSSNVTNGIMALVYWLVVCREKPERELRAWHWRGLMYGYPWLWGIGYSAAARYSVRPAKYPTAWYCYGLFAEPGSKGAVISFWVILAFFVLSVILILLSMGALVRYVYKQEKRMDQFQVSEPTHGSSISNTLANRRKTVQVAKQGFLYAAAFLVICTLMVLNGCVTILPAELTLPMGYYVFFAVVYPLQGCFNCCIYFRPKIVTVRQRERLPFRHAITRVLHLNFLRRGSVPEVETPEHSNTQPEVGSTKGSTSDGQVRRMSNALIRMNLEASTEMETSKADETGSEVHVNARGLATGEG